MSDSFLNWTKTKVSRSLDFTFSLQRWRCFLFPKPPQCLRRFIAHGLQTTLGWLYWWGCLTTASGQQVPWRSTAHLLCENEIEDNPTPWEILTTWCEKQVLQLYLSWGRKGEREGGRERGGREGGRKKQTPKATSLQRCWRFISLWALNRIDSHSEWGAALPHSVPDTDLTGKTAEAAACTQYWDTWLWDSIHWEESVSSTMGNWDSSVSSLRLLLCAPGSV